MINIDSVLQESKFREFNSICNKHRDIFDNFEELIIQIANELISGNFPKQYGKECSSIHNLFYEYIDKELPNVPTSIFIRAKFYCLVKQFEDRNYHIMNYISGYESSRKLVLMKL